MAKGKKSTPTPPSSPDNRHNAVNPGTSRTVSSEELKNLVNCAVTNALEEAFARFDQKFGQKFENTNKKLKSTRQFTQQTALLNKYANDQVEQYTRRDNLRLFGIPEEDHEDLEQKIIEIAKSINVDLCKDDFSVAHRLGPKTGPGSGKHRAIIVRFVRRKKRNELLANKKHLKNHTTKIFIAEDLTSLKLRLLKEVKASPRVKMAYSKEGRIMARLAGNEKEEIEINSPDDLWKVGTEQPRWEELGLTNWVITEDPVE
jgi:hypothetical protein